MTRTGGETVANNLTTRSVGHAEITPAFVQDVEELLNRAFDGWPRLDLPVSTRDHLEWKMTSLVPGLPAAIIAELDGRLASYRTLLARRILVEQRPRLFLHFVDAAVEPELQGRGVNAAMQQLMKDEFHSQFDFSIDDSTNETIVRGRTRLGVVHEFGNPVQPYIVPLEFRRLAWSGSARQMPARVARLLMRSTASVLARLVARAQRDQVSDCSIRTVVEFDSRFDGFCAEAAAPFDFIAERTAAFLNWRYADPRGGDFTIRIAERDGRLLGYVVTKAGDEMTRVADILVAPGEPSVAGALIRDVVRAAREARSAAVMCWLPRRHPYRRALHASGLVALGRKTSLVYRAVSIGEKELAFLQGSDASMHLLEGDTDFI